MKMKTTILVVIMILTMQACNAATVTSTTSAPETVTATAQPQNIQMTPEVSTAVGIPDEATLPPIPEATETLSPGDNPFPKNDAITMEDNGKTFTMHVGDSVLLNLGIDTYEWEVSIDNPDILRTKIGVMVIRGAQGIYEALAPGATTITASGNPLCSQTRPACAMPSIFFSVTIIVK